MESRGGLYSEGPGQAFDSQEPHIRTLLGFIGIIDVTFIRAEKLAFAAEAREQAIAAAPARSLDMFLRASSSTRREPASKATIRRFADSNPTSRQVSDVPKSGPRN